MFDKYLPTLEQHISHIDLSLLEKAELTENTIGTVVKLLYAFFWQEDEINFGGEYIEKRPRIYVINTLKMWSSDQKSMSYGAPGPQQ